MKFERNIEDGSEMFEHNARERRNFVRVRPSDEEPVFIQLGGKTIQVCDISAGGTSFKNHKLKEGQNQSIKINLPDKTTIKSIIMRIISIDKNGICHAKFIKAETSEREKIHQYALKRQVEIARRNKNLKQRNWHMGHAQ